MQYSTFYAKLIPNGAIEGTKYSVSVSGITATTDGQKSYGSAPMYFAIKPKSSGTATVSFLNDTTGDVIGTKQILVRSNTLANATYTLDVSATSVNEGGSVTFTVDTSDVPVNTNIPYTITGISVADISLTSLTGNFKVTPDGTAKLVINIIEDQLTEPVETLTLTLDGKGLSKSVTINDTSKTPTYDIGWYANATGSTVKLTNANEGDVVYLVAKTTNVPNATILKSTLSGPGITSKDTDVTGTVQFSITNNIGSMRCALLADNLTEGPEVLTSTVTNWTDTTVGTVGLIINDTSKNAIYYKGTYNFTVTPGKELTVDMYPSGGGGGSSAYSTDGTVVAGTDGDPIILSQGAKLIKAGGGFGGTGGKWGNGSSYTNGEPGLGGTNDITTNGGLFTILSNIAGNNAVTGNRFAQQPMAPGAYTNEYAMTNNGGQGGWGVGDENWSYGGSGGGGARLKAKYTNTGSTDVVIQLVIGNSGVKATGGSNKGTDASSVAHALVSIVDVV